MLMPRQSLRITRQLPCDTLLRPGKRTNDVQTARFEPSDFCKWKVPAAKFENDTIDFAGAIINCPRAQNVDNSIILGRAASFCSTPRFLNLIQIRQSVLLTEIGGNVGDKGIK